MRKVWKIGTRWGDYGPSNLDLFFNYGCAFFNVDGSRIGDYTRAKPGDLLLVCDRSKPVAIAQMTSAFTDYAESGINFCELDKKEWVDPYSIVICKVRFHMIPNGEKANWHNDSRKRFCSHSTGEIVNEKWEQYENAAARGAFDIKSRTVSFLASDTESGVFSPLIRYRVPVYQRPYSWGEQELRRLMEDLREAVRNTEPVFLGTMQLSAPIPLGEAGCAYDIIDGQQRTSTLMLLRCLLEEKLGRLKTDDGRERLYITHVNRGAAQRELDEFWNAWRKGELTSCSSDKNPYLSNVACLNNLLDEYFFSKEEDGSSISPEKLLDFLETNLRFVVIETHAGLSKTLRIFNTINTTGLDLGADDLFKIRFYEYRKDVVRDSDDVFDSISGVYERVSEARKKAVGGFTFSMSDVLDVYKRVLIARYKMKSDLDRFATPRFFESLFDSLLNVRKWPELKDVDVELKVEDLDGIVDAFEIMSKAFKENDHLYVIHHFLLETRYGFVWNYLAVALFFRSITPDEMLEFETHLFKLLVPPSLRWAKMVYSVQSELWKILHALPDNEGKGVDLLKTYLEKGLCGEPARDSFRQSCGAPVTYYPKWKNLLCRLCEYLAELEVGKPSVDKLFRTAIDIEHIQSYTDIKDPEAVRAEWGEELHCLGNLVMFESSRNRSVRNDVSKKPAEYAKSVFASVRELSSKVEHWTRDDAVARREKLTVRMEQFLFSE